MRAKFATVYGAGFLTGAGFALFLLFVVAQGVTVSLDGTVRIVVGIVGLLLLAVGGVAGVRLRSGTDRAD